TGQLSIGSTTQLNFAVDEYTGNETTPGVYIMSLHYSNTSGNEGVHNFTVEVLDDENDDSIILNPELSLWDQLINFVETKPIESALIGASIVIVIVVILMLIFSDKKTNRRYGRR